MPCSESILDQVSENLVSVFAKQTSRAFWDQLRGELRRCFGSYYAWPQPLRHQLDQSNNYHVVEFLGRTHDFEERYRDAEAAFERLRRIPSPDQGDLYCNACIELALLYQHQDEHGKALALLQETLDEPDAQQRYDWQYGRLQHHLGNQLRRMGELDRGRRDPPFGARKMAKYGKVVHSHGCLASPGRDRI